MRRRSLMLAAVTRGNRHEVTAAIGDAVTSAGGWIVDHALYSNVAVSVRCSLPAASLDRFRQRLVEAGVTLDAASVAALDEQVAREMPADAEVAAALNLTFVNDEPDLRRVVPPVPG